MRNCYLDLLPKDIARIVYRYLYDFVPHQIIRVVDPYICVDRYRYRYQSVLTSPVCKICPLKKHSSFWKRPSTYSRIMDICEQLKQCQDSSGLWNRHFPETHRISIINGIVYHLKKDSNKLILVPYFESDYCWQDLAMRFMQIQNCNSNSQEIQNCMDKYQKHDKMLHPPQRDNGCILC